MLTGTWVDTSDIINNYHLPCISACMQNSNDEGIFSDVCDDLQMEMLPI